MVLGHLGSMCRQLYITQSLRKYALRDCTLLEKIHWTNQLPFELVHHHRPINFFFMVSNPVFVTILGKERLGFSHGTSKIQNAAFPGKEREVFTKSFILLRDRNFSFVKMKLLYTHTHYWFRLELGPAERCECVFSILCLFSPWVNRDYLKTGVAFFFQVNVLSLQEHFIHLSALRKSEYNS